MRGATSVSLASHLSSCSWRPRMPPAALHQPTNASALSKSSWFRPGSTVVPGSDIVPTRMVVSETPSAVAPLAVPGPHTALRVPKSPVAAFAVVDGVPPPLPLPLDRLQPAAASATARNGRIHRLNLITSPQSDIVDGRPRRADAADGRLRRPRGARVTTPAPAVATGVLASWRRLSALPPGRGAPTS